MWKENQGRSSLAGDGEGVRRTESARKLWAQKALCADTSKFKSGGPGGRPSTVTVAILYGCLCYAVGIPVRPLPRSPNGDSNNRNCVRSLTGLAVVTKPSVGAALWSSRFPSVVVVVLFGGGGSGGGGGVGVCSPENSTRGRDWMRWARRRKHGRGPSDAIHREFATVCRGGGRAHARYRSRIYRWSNAAIRRD